MPRLDHLSSVLQAAQLSGSTRSLTSENLQAEKERKSYKPVARFLGCGFTRVVR